MPMLVSARRPRLSPRRAGSSPGGRRPRGRRGALRRHHAVAARARATTTSRTESSESYRTFDCSRGATRRRARPVDRRRRAAGGGGRVALARCGATRRSRSSPRAPRSARGGRLVLVAAWFRDGSDPARRPARRGSRGRCPALVGGAQARERAGENADRARPPARGADRVPASAPARALDLPRASSRRSCRWRPACSRSSRRSRCCGSSNDVQPISVFALNLVTGAGLGLAIDYSLLLVSRFREELARSARVGGAARDAGDRGADRRVQRGHRRRRVRVAARLPAAVPALDGDRRRCSSRRSPALVASAAAAGALRAARRARERARSARWQRAAERAARPDEHGGWYRFAHWVMRRPAPPSPSARRRCSSCSACRSSACASSASTRPCCRRARARGRSTTCSDARSRPGSTRRCTSRSPTARAPPRRDPTACRASRDGDAASALGPRLWSVDVIPRAGAMSEQTKQLVRRIRALPGGLGRRHDGVVPRHGRQPAAQPAARARRSSRSRRSCCSSSSRGRSCCR